MYFDRGNGLCKRVSQLCDSMPIRLTPSNETTLESLMQAVSSPAFKLAFSALLGLYGMAHAATVTVACEKRADRSRISVDGAGLTNRTQYYAVASSGANLAQAQPEVARRGEAQFDFDSNPHDIAMGATAISPTFIVDAKVTGSIHRLDGTQVGIATATCRVR